MNVIHSFLYKVCMMSRKGIFHVHEYRIFDVDDPKCMSGLATSLETSDFFVLRLSQQFVIHHFPFATKSKKGRWYVFIFEPRVFPGRFLFFSAQWLINEYVLQDLLHILEDLLLVVFLEINTSWITWKRKVVRKEVELTETCGVILMYNGT